MVSEIALLSDFASLKLSNRLLETIAAEGYEKPTPIQAQAIPPVLKGRDLLGCAQTGTGKTAAFALPIIERLLKEGPPTRRNERRKTRALILAPTRELALQIEESLRTYGRKTGLRHVVIYGGVKQFRQVRKLEAGVDIIVATPGRLIDLMDQGFIDLRAVRTFVLDEADRMLDMGFIEPIREIAEALPRKRQTLLFSATMPPKIRNLAESLLHNPVSVSVAPVASTAPLIDQELYHVSEEHKVTLLNYLLLDPKIARTVVFTKTKHGAEKLAKKLAREGVTAGAIHGNKSQNQRERSLAAFRSGRSRVLVATDVAARGLDVDGITHVINYNLPNEPEAYVHRIGRTGRAGASGQAISFCSRAERGFLRSIERLTGKPIDTTDVPEELEIPNEAQGARRPRAPRRRPGNKPTRHNNQGAKHGSGARSNAKRNRRKKKTGHASPAHAAGGNAGKASRGRRKGGGRASSRQG